jgi:phage shock protein PspC (stress-responsive transcriptional regulator)
MNIKEEFDSVVKDATILEYSFAILAVCTLTPLVLAYLILSKLVAQPLKKLFKTWK